MMEFLEFTFRSFWHFVGVWMLILLGANVIVRTLALICGRFNK